MVFRTLLKSKIWTILQKTASEFGTVNLYEIVKRLIQWLHLIETHYSFTALRLTAILFRMVYKNICQYINCVVFYQILFGVNVFFKALNTFSCLSIYQDHHFQTFSSILAIELGQDFHKTTKRMVTSLVTHSFTNKLIFHYPHVRKYRSLRSLDQITTVSGDSRLRR